MVTIATPCEVHNVVMVNVDELDRRTWCPRCE